jgi:hypothetical protein
MRQICPNCQQSVNMAESDAGKTVPCPACQQPFAIPALFTPTVFTPPPVPALPPIIPDPPSPSVEVPTPSAPDEGQTPTAASTPPEAKAAPTPPALSGVKWAASLRRQW